MHKSKYILKNQFTSVALPGFWFGGNTLGGQPRGGSGGGAPRTPENFRKISKNLLWKLLKMHYFSIFFKKVNKACVNFSLVWTKNTNFGEILKNFEKCSEVNCKNPFVSYFSKELTNRWVSFFAVWTKNTYCWEILRNFWKFLIKFQ